MKTWLLIILIIFILVVAFLIILNLDRFEIKKISGSGEDYDIIDNINKASAKMKKKFNEIIKKHIDKLTDNQEYLILVKNNRISAIIVYEKEKDVSIRLLHNDDSDVHQGVFNLQILLIKLFSILECPIKIHAKLDHFHQIHTFVLQRMGFISDGVVLTKYINEYNAIHIDGFPGSGKTTLGKRLKGMNIDYIDTDDEFDTINYKCAKSKAYNKYLRNGDFFYFSSKVIDLYTKHIYNILNRHKYSNSTKPLIFIGSSSNLRGLKIDKYYIESKPEDLYKRIYRRFFNESCNNLDEINKTIQRESPYFLNTALSSLNKVRFSLVGHQNYNDFIKDSSNYTNLLISDNYKPISSDSIFTKITELYKKN